MTEEINKKKTFLFEFQKVQCISFMIRVDNWLSPVLARVAMPVVPEVPVQTVSPRFYLDIYLRSSSTFFTIRSKENLNYFWSLCVLMYGSILSTFCDVWILMRRFSVHKWHWKVSCQLKIFFTSYSSKKSIDPAQSNFQCLSLYLSYQSRFVTKQASINPLWYQQL